MSKHKNLILIVLLAVLMMTVFKINVDLRQSYFALGGFVYFDSVSYVFAASQSAEQIQDEGLWFWINNRVSDVSPLSEVFSAVLFPNSLKSPYPFAPFTILSMLVFAVSVAARAKHARSSLLAVGVLATLFITSPFALGLYGGSSDTWLESAGIWLVGSSWLFFLNGLELHDKRAMLFAGIVTGVALLTRETLVVLTIITLFVALFLGLFQGGTSDSPTNLYARMKRILPLGLVFSAPVVVVSGLILLLQFSSLTTRASRNVGVDLFTEQDRLSAYIFHDRLLESGLPYFFVGLVILILVCSKAPLIDQGEKRESTYLDESQNARGPLTSFGVLTFAISIIAFNIVMYQLAIAYHSINLVNYLLLSLLCFELSSNVPERRRWILLPGLASLAVIATIGSLNYYKSEGDKLLRSTFERQLFYNEILQSIEEEQPEMVALYFEAANPLLSVYGKMVQSPSIEVTLAPTLKQHGQVLFVSAPTYSDQDWINSYLMPLESEKSLVFTYCKSEDVINSIESGLWSKSRIEIPKTILEGVNAEVNSANWYLAAELTAFRIRELGGKVCAFRNYPRN